MAYKIHSGNPLNQEILRIFEEELVRTQKFLSAEENRHEAIHQSRKCFKKIRALLRLIRREIGESRYRKENVFYRNIARSLSDIRDSQALIEALELLEKEAPEKIDTQALQELLHHLVAQRDEAAKKILEEEKRMEVAASVMADQAKHSLGLPLKRKNFRLIKKGLHKIYTQGYRAHFQVSRWPEMDHVHNWRKRVKYLLHHIQLLNDAWPSVYKAYELELKRLASLLGNWRDLGLLDLEIQQTASIPDPVKAQVASQIKVLQHTYLEEALMLGKRVYLHSPKEFVYQVEALWSTAEAWAQSGQKKEVLEEKVK